MSVWALLRPRLRAPLGLVEYGGQQGNQGRENVNPRGRGGGARALVIPAVTLLLFQKLRKLLNWQNKRGRLPGFIPNPWSQWIYLNELQPRLQP